MKVILQSELRGKGGEGDVIDVADGYANNFLLPQRIAIKATPGNLKQLEQKRKNIAKREAVRVTDAEKFKETIEGKVVRVLAKIGDEGQLFGSVTAAQVADAALEQLGIEIDRKRIELKPIKVVGVHPATVSLYRQIAATIYVDVNDAAGFAAADAAAKAEAEEVAEAEEEA
ncbi:MAG: 50S ribosomal protein L9 [Coriobacteriales bacterium]|nr:50S ribosomal protein L9 [Coriobacteriales bacterium]